MTKQQEKQDKQPKWLDNLRALMASKEFNPRSLSLKAGLNATAVRDMLEGRAKFPRYDTIEALARALDVAPAQLMGGGFDLPEREGEKTVSKTSQAENDALADDDLNLLTEIITRLQETAHEYRQSLKPKDFAAMVTTIYREVQSKPSTTKSGKAAIDSHAHHLITYETLRQRAASRK